MLSLHHYHLKQNRELADLSNFDASTFNSLCRSIYTHVKNNPFLCLSTTAVSYGVSIGLQTGNEALGYVMGGSAQNTTYDATIQSGATGVVYSYPALFIFHHLSSIGYSKLDLQDQNALKHLFALAHDFVSCLTYSKVGGAATNAEINYLITVGAPVVTLIAILVVFVMERYTGRDVLVTREMYNNLLDFIKCCEKYTPCKKAVVIEQDIANDINDQENPNPPPPPNSKLTLA